MTNELHMHECGCCGHHHLANDAGYFDCWEDNRYVLAEFLTADERVTLPDSAIITAVEHGSEYAEQWTEYDALGDVVEEWLGGESVEWVSSVDMRAVNSIRAQHEQKQAVETN